MSPALCPTETQEILTQLLGLQLQAKALHSTNFQVICKAPSERIVDKIGVG